MNKVKKKAKKTRPKIDRQTHQIDAEGQVLGRLASQIAILLMGKNKPNYQAHIDQGDRVEITNASKMKFTGKKMEQKIYYHYSGYPGGMKERKLKDLFKKDPADILKRAVYNMLPKNRLRRERMKRLKITN